MSKFGSIILFMVNAFAGVAVTIKNNPPNTNPYPILFSITKINVNLIYYTPSFIFATAILPSEVYLPTLNTPGL
jgi:hypothetical protein